MRGDNGPALLSGEAAFKLTAYLQPFDHATSAGHGQADPEGHQDRLQVPGIPPGWHPVTLEDLRPAGSPGVGHEPDGHAIRVGVPLLEHEPQQCPYGHTLGPGQVGISWQPCVCAAAQEAAARGRGMGHHRIDCRQCESRGRLVTFYEPPHDGEAWHVREMLIVTP